jgi:hypothetical protein
MTCTVIALARPPAACGEWNELFCQPGESQLGGQSCWHCILALLLEQVQTSADPEEHWRPAQPAASLTGAGYPPGRTWSWNSSA